MMRTGLIVVGLSTVTIMELGTASRTKTNARDPFDQLMIDAKWHLADAVVGSRVLVRQLTRPTLRFGFD